MLLLIFKQIIIFYQHTLSPDHGPLRVIFPAGVCRFRPTCSEYMLIAISEKGWPGALRGLKRLLRCHPYSAL